MFLGTISKVHGNWRSAHDLKKVLAELNAVFLFLSMLVLLLFLFFFLMTLYIKIMNKPTIFRKITSIDFIGLCTILSVIVLFIFS